jgi:hypothetical protein
MRERTIRVGAVLVIVSLGIAYAWLSFPANREDTSRLLDFSEFYAAATMVRQGLGAKLYDLRLQAEFQLEVAPVHAFYLRPPFETALFLPLTYLGYRAAYMAWLATSVLLLLLTAWMIRANTRVLDALLRYARGIPIDFGLLFILFVTFAPTMNCLLIGQDSIVMLMIYTLVFCVLKRGHEGKAGGILALGLFKYHLAIPFVIVCAIRRRYSFLIGFSIVAIILVGVSMVISGPGVLLTYPRMFLNPGYRALMNFQPEYAANLHGLIWLIFHNSVPRIVSAGITIVLSGVLLWFTARRWDGDQFELSFSAAVVGAVLTGFHAFVYDLCLLLLPLSIVCSELVRRKSSFAETGFNAALLILMIPPIHHVLTVYHVYAIMGLVLLLLLRSIMKMMARPARRNVLPMHA